MCAAHWFSTLGEHDIDKKSIVIYPLKHRVKLISAEFNFISQLHNYYPLIIDLSGLDTKGVMIDSASDLVFDRKNRQIFMVSLNQSYEIVLKTMLIHMNAHTDDK